MPEDLVKAIREELEGLLKDTKNLKQVREELAKFFLKEAGIPIDELDNFYKYAKAMQVLESLAGLKGKGKMEISRITPFDLYRESDELQKQKPLAGGALGAFGGFLDKGWRLNDFLVGRLVMRRRLQSEYLIPEGRFPDYLEAVKEMDRKVLRKLAAGSKEREKFEQLMELSPENQGPYADDQQKPEGFLLREDGMSLDVIAPNLVLRIFRRVSSSLRRLFKQNKELKRKGFNFYSLLSRLNPLLFIIECVAWLFEKTLLTKSQSVLNNYIRVLLIGIILGLLIGLFLFLWIN